MKRAVIYARVSTVKQADEGISIEAQVEHCTRRAEQLGAEVVSVFRDEGASGRSVKGRSQFQAALAYCAAGGVRYMIVWSTSRFARNALDFLVQQELLKASGTRLECLNAEVDDETDSGFINRSIYGMVDELHSRAIARDTLRSMKKSAAEGWFTGGRVPFGYQAVAVGKRRKLEEHPDDAMVIRRIFELCLQGLGAQAIAIRMNEARMLRHGAPWKKNSVGYIVKNTVYTGLKTFNRTNSKTGIAKPRDEWVQLKAHPPLVSQEDFERAQLMIEERTPHEHGGTGMANWVFVGKLFCGVCSQAMQIVTGKGRKGTLYSYYGCVAHRKGLTRCLARPMRADHFDDWLMAEIVDKVLTAEVVKNSIQEVMGMAAGFAKERERRRGELVKEIRGVEAKRDKLLDSLEEGVAGLEMADVAQRLRRRNDELEGLQIELHMLEMAKLPTQHDLRTIDPEIAIEVLREVVMNGDAKKNEPYWARFWTALQLSARKSTSTTTRRRCCNRTVVRLFAA